MRYILNGFPSKKTAEERQAKLIEKLGINNKFSFPVFCIVEEWGLEISSNYIDLLEDHERTPQRLRKRDPFIIPYIPKVYRFLESEFVDEFFKSGKLRIASFKKFRKHKDEQRGDTTEGKNQIMGLAGDKLIGSFTTVGNDAFVLSTSLMYSKQLFDDFNVNSCFIIDSPDKFMNVIINKIPDFKGIQYGPCIYQPDTILTKNTEINEESLKSDLEPDKFDLEKMMKASFDMGGNHMFFRKTSEFSTQHEYRMIWHSYDDDLPDYIDIEVPEAITFCRKIV